MRSPFLILLSCFLSLCLVGCTPSDSIPPTASALGGGPGEVSTKTYNYVPATLARTSIFTDAEFITAARKVMVQDDYIVIGDSRGDTLIRVFDTNGRHLGSLGANGQGPGEFMTVWWMVDGRTANPGIWFFDIGNQRLTHHNFSEYPKHIDQINPFSIRLIHDGPITNIAWLDDDDFLGIGRLSEGRFAYFDMDGEVVRVTGTLPNFRSEAPMKVRQQAYVGYTLRHPSDSLLVEVTRFADRLTIYDFDGNVLHHARTSNPYEPEDEMRILMREKPPQGKDFTPRYAFLDVTANEEVIYALYSGRADGTPRSNYGNLVFAFDWAGNFLKSYQLDEDVFSITLTPSGKSLFAVRHNPSPAILQIDLKQFL